MNQDQKTALKVVIDYLNQTEKPHFEEWINEGNNPENHIFNHVQKLNEYLAKN